MSPVENIQGWPAAPASLITHYVAGFMFDGSRVALIRKSKPQWQAGLLNGIGGKVEAEEDPKDAMVREFLEETGAQTTAEQWSHFTAMGGENHGFVGWRVDFYACRGDVDALRTMESEPIEIVSLESIHPLRADMVENLMWLISLALDHLNDHRPRFVKAEY